MADRTVYVDGTTSGTPGTNGAHYASLQAMVTGETGAAPNLVGDSAILHVECSVFSGNAADTTACTINGFTTNSSFYVRVYTASASRHNGTWQSTKYRLETANSTALIVRQPYTRLEGLQVGKSAVNANDQSAIEFIGSDTGTFYVSNLITRHAPESFRQMGIWIANNNATVYVWNWIDYGHPAVESFYNSPFVMEATGTAYCYSATLIGAHSGVWLTAAGIVNMKNTYASGGTGNAYQVTVGTLNQTNCASSDATAGGTAPQTGIAVNTTNFTNITFATADYRLPSGSGLIDFGTNTSGESAPLNGTATDIVGETRTGTWDIGADSYEVAAPVVAGPVIPSTLRPAAFAPGAARKFR